VPSRAGPTGKRTLVDTAAAATAAGVKPALIRRWAARYPKELPRRGRDPRGRTLYSLADVYTLAARLRRKRPSAAHGGLRTPADGRR
jgi:hypothetical protein